MALLDATKLAAFMQRQLKAASAEVAIEVAEGWLHAAASIDPWPADASAADPQLVAWAIELSAIAYDNPTGLGSRTVGATARAFALERRSEILAAAAVAYPKANPAGSPVAGFPPPVYIPTRPHRPC